MTAKEIASEAFGIVSTKSDQDNIDILSEKIRAYARQKCMDQRKLCADVIRNGKPWWVIPINDILNAPKPKFD